MLRFLVILIVFAVVVYLVTRTLQERGNPRRGARPTGRGRAGSGANGNRSLTDIFPHLGRKEPPRPKAPDDDEDFLRDLDRKRREPPEDA